MQLHTEIWSMAKDLSVFSSMDRNNRTDGCICTKKCILPLYLHSGYRTVLAGAYALLEGAVPGSWQREKRKEYHIRKLRIIEEETTGGNKVWNFYNRQWIISGEIF